MSGSDATLGPPLRLLPAPPLVSVVIPSCNRRDSLQQVLDALAQQTYPAEQFEVIVALDGSEDGSREMLARHGLGERLTMLWQPNRGAGTARNLGANRARGELLVLLDDDVIAAPDLLSMHVRAHAEGVGDVVLGRLLFSARGARTAIVEREADWYERHFEELARPDHAFRYADFFAGNVSLSKRHFLAVGGFDESFGAYGCEDWELGARLLKAGLRFGFFGNAVGEHRYGVDFEGWQRHAFWDGRSEARFAQKHPALKYDLQLVAYFQGSRKRRVASRLLRLAPRAWPRLVASVTRLYLRAERLGYARLAARLARVIWIYRYWSGLRTELGGDRAVDRFLGFRVPILAYHRVTERPNPALAEYSVSPGTFRRQLAWLRRTGHQAVSLAAFYDAYRGATPLPPRPVIITFDDGYEDTSTVAARILGEFGFPAAVFVVADRVGGQNDWDAAFGPPPARLMGWSQVRQLAADGMEIGGHTATHPALTQLSESELASELRDSRATIERHLADPVRWFAYPHGDHDTRVRAATQQAGYVAGFGYSGGFAAASDDLFALNRIPVGERDGIAGFALKLVLGENWWTAVKRSVPGRIKTAGRRVLGRGHSARGLAARGPQPGA